MIPTFARSLLLALVVAACTPTSDALTEEARQAVAAQVTQAVAELTAAMNAHDGDAVMGFYSGAPDFVYLGCTEYIRGGEAFAEMAAPFYAANPDVTIQQEIESLRVVGPEVAVVSLRGGQPDGPPLFWTQVWERGDEGRWIITVEHESWPGCPEPRGPHPLTSEGEPGSSEASSEGN